MYFCPVLCCDLLLINIQIKSPVYDKLPGRQLFIYLVIYFIIKYLACQDISSLSIRYLACQDIRSLSIRHLPCQDIRSLSIRHLACQDISSVSIRLEKYLLPCTDTCGERVNIEREHLQVNVQGFPCKRASLSKPGLTCSSLLQDSLLHTPKEDCQRYTVPCTACAEHSSAIYTVPQKNTSLHCPLSHIVITTHLPNNVSTEFVLKELGGGDICLLVLSGAYLEAWFSKCVKTKKSVCERVRGTKTCALVVFSNKTWINQNSNGVINIMNNEREDDGTVNQGCNADHENASENTDDIGKDGEDNQHPVSVNTGTGGGSGTVNKDMVTADSSSTSGIATVSGNTQAHDPFASANTVSHFPGSDDFNKDTAQAGSSVRPRYGSDSYTSLKLIGICRRKKFFAPEDSYFSVEDDGVAPANSQSGSVASDEYSNNEAMTLDPSDMYNIGMDFPARKGCFNTSSTCSNRQAIDESKQKLINWDISSDADQISEYKNVDQDKRLESFKEKSTQSTSSIDSSPLRLNSTFLTPVNKPVQELESVKPYYSEITTPAEIDEEKSKNMLKEALRQIIEENETLKHSRHQQNCPGSSEDTSESSSLENSTLDSQLKVCEATCYDRQGESSHTRHCLPNFSHDLEGSENDEFAPLAWELSPPKHVGKFSGKITNKRSVHFADSVGLGLSTIRLVSNSESPPTIPKSVLDALMLGMDDEPREVSQTFLSPCFDQPGADFNFLKKVLDQKICLENILVSDMKVNGYVRVAKIAPYQCVLARYSVDDWFSFEEINAAFISATPDGLTERFSFVLEVSPHMEPGSYVELVVIMISNNIEYVDSNDGDNYRLECVQVLFSPVAN